MKLQFIGATGTVTGSRIRIEHKDNRLLVDCGLYQGPKEIRQKNWSDPQPGFKGCTGVLLTHAHIDHSGLLPLLVKEGFRGPIYCSEPTYDLCRLLLPDAGKLQEEDAKFLNEKRLTHFNPALPLFTEADARRALPFFEVVKDSQWIPLKNNLKFKMERSGHILGSRFIELANEARVLFSGDLGPPKSLLLKEPTRMTETDYLVLESTYGNRNHWVEDRESMLADVVNRVLGRGGTLIIPSFAVGRAQDILFLLRKLEEGGRIPKVPVYVDSPMALDATKIYQHYDDEMQPEILKGIFSSPMDSVRFKAVNSTDESMLLCMDDSPKIVISAAGMLNGGRVLHHLKAKLPSEKNAVLFVGYQVTGTKGALLKNGLRNIRIHHQLVDVEAEIFSISSLSAHADSDEIIRWCSGFRAPPKKTFLVHGEDEPRQALAYRLRYELGWEVATPKENEEHYLGG